MKPLRRQLRWWWVLGENEVFFGFFRSTLLVSIVFGEYWLWKKVYLFSFFTSWHLVTWQKHSRCGSGGEKLEDYFLSSSLSHSFHDLEFCSWFFFLKKKVPCRVFFYFLLSLKRRSAVVDVNNVYSPMGARGNHCQAVDVGWIVELQGDDTAQGSFNVVFFFFH